MLEETWDDIWCLVAELGVEPAVEHFMEHTMDTRRWDFERPKRLVPG